MTTAWVEVLGEAIEPDGLTWQAATAQIEGKTEVRFQAPTDRRLRVIVRDWHGRELGKKYESTHAPGSTPINQAFIIQLPGSR